MLGDGWLFIKTDEANPGTIMAVKHMDMDSSDRATVENTENQLDIRLLTH